MVVGGWIDIFWNNILLEELESNLNADLFKEPRESTTVVQVKAGKERREEVELVQNGTVE